MNQIDVKNGPVMFLSGVIVGALAGAIAGFWMAPQSGKKTQKLIRQEAQRLRHTAEHAVDDIKEGVESASDDIREKVQSARHDGRGWLNQRADQAGKLSAKLREAVAQ
jgi:gas vesicle protein